MLHVLSAPWRAALDHKTVCACLVASLMVLSGVFLPVPSQALTGALPSTPILELRQVKLGNIFLDTEDPRIEVATAGQTFDFSVTDYWGATVASGSRTVVANQPFSLDLPKARGYFIITVTAKLFGVNIATRQAAFAVLAPQNWAGVDDSQFAVQTFMNSADPRTVSLLAKAGAKTVRDSVLWEKVETSRGIYQYSPGDDSYMQQLADENINPFLILAYGNPNYDGGNAPYTADGINGYVNYSKNVVQHYGPSLQAVEVYNEYNSFGSGPAHGSPQSYLNTIAPTYRALKDMRPDLTISGGSVSTQPGLTPESSQPDYAWLEQFFALGGLQHLDVLSLHVYTPYAPEGYSNEQTIPSFELMLNRVDTLVRKYNNGQPKPIWVTETGWGSGTLYPSNQQMVSNEVNQANFLVRGLTTMYGHSAVEKVSWYALSDVVPYPTKVVGLDFGLIRFPDVATNSYHQILPKEPLGNHTPKPAYVAYNVLAGQLLDMNFDSKVDYGNGVVGYNFVGNGRTRQVIWSTGAAHVIQVKVASQATVTNIMGGYHTVNPSANGSVTVTASSTPIYIDLGS